MCAIIDANVAHELKGTDRHEAGTRFLDRVDSGKLPLVVGGKLREELYRTPIWEWIRQALLAGKALSFDDDEVDRKTTELQDLGGYISDDPHIIALAQISPARLLYSNDRALQTDFKKKGLVDGRRGRIYSTLMYKSFKDSHRRLLDRRDLCKAGQSR